MLENQPEYLINLAEDEFVDFWRKRFDAIKVRCRRCIYDDQTPSIKFDDDGVCNYCHLHDQLNRQYPSGDAGQLKIKEVADQIRKEGRRKPFDLIVGVSGGCDSSYLLHLAKELKLRPLAVHYDNTWNSKIAVENIHNVLKKLNVELSTYVVDNEEYDDMFLAFLKAGSIDFDIQSDIALATVLNKAAEKHGIRYIFEGHSFRTEGVSPLGWAYMDAKYIYSVHKQFGLRPMKTYPNLWLSSQLKWMCINQIKKIRPLWYIDYNKEEVKKFLTKEFNWRWYGGHHLENRLSHFGMNFFHPRRNGIDQRKNGFSGLCRSGQMTREEAIEELRTPPVCDPELLALFKKRMRLDDESLKYYFCLPRTNYKDFKTYKKIFERYRPFFWLMAKMDLIPMSFYVKYTSKSEI